MKLYKLLFVLLAITLVPSAAFAQQRFEFAPFIGWQHGNDIFDQPTSTRISMANGSAYGFIVDVSITDNLQAEFIYNRRSTTVDVTAPPRDGFPDGINIQGAPVIANYYQGGLLYNFSIWNKPQFKPFIGFGLGAASLSENDDRTDAPSTTNFSWSVTGGIKYFFTDNIGFRGEYRLFSTHTDFVQRGYWCDWWGWCWTFASKQNLWQSQFLAAFVIGF
jgi:opacity protein-like surface antigen